jgi:hypothetical protein
VTTLHYPIGLHSLDIDQYLSKEHLVMKHVIRHGRTRVKVLDLD